MSLAPFPESGWLFRWAKGPFARPVSYPFGPNPWNTWRLFTIRLARVTLPFISYNGKYIHGYLGGKQFATGAYPDAGHTWMTPEEADTLFVTWSARLGFGRRS